MAARSRRRSRSAANAASKPIDAHARRFVDADRKRHVADTSIAESMFRHSPVFAQSVTRAVNPIRRSAMHAGDQPRRRVPRHARRTTPPAGPHRIRPSHVRSTNRRSHPVSAIASPELRRGRVAQSDRASFGCCRCRRRSKSVANSTCHVACPMAKSEGTAARPCFYVKVELHLRNTVPAETARRPAIFQLRLNARRSRGKLACSRPRSRAAGSPRRSIRARGGIGRRARLRALCPQGRAGSTPVGPTESRELRVEIRPKSLFAALDSRLLSSRLLIETGTRNQRSRVPFLLRLKLAAQCGNPRIAYNSNGQRRQP